MLVSEELDEPRAIAVDPVGGHMYWSDWSERRPKIERAALDGSRRSALFDTDIKWPNGIALDLQLRMVYWCDAGKDRIEVSAGSRAGPRGLTLACQPGRARRSPLHLELDIYCA